MRGSLIRQCVAAAAILVSSLAPVVIRAQTDTVTVPNLVGMSVPQAAQVVADGQLLFKTEIQRAWTADAKVKPNQISEQSPAAGQTVAQGSQVEVTVLRVINVVLVYTSDTLTLVNLSQGPLDMDGVTFKSVVGKEIIEYAAADWGEADLLPQTCNQVRVAKATPTPRPAECTAVRFSKELPAKARPFWAGAQTGLASFRIERYGDYIATCNVSEGRCEVSLPQGEDDPEHTAHLLFHYRTNYLTVRNSSAERWMGLSGVELSNAAGKKLRLDSFTEILPGDVAWIGDRLAPGQCIVYTEVGLGLLPAFDCRVVGYVKLAQGQSIWQKGFTSTVLAGQEQTVCPAPRPGQLSICLAPK